MNQAAQKGDQGEAGQRCPPGIQGRVMSRAIAAIFGSIETSQARPFGALGETIAAFWHGLTRDIANPYRPEKHYMRGPGPAWQAKHGAK